MKSLLRVIIGILVLNLNVMAEADWSASLAKVVRAYPSADIDGPMNRRMFQLLNLLKQNNDPLLNDPDAPWKLACMAAEMLKIKKGKQPIAAVPVPAPAPPRVASLAKTYEQDAAEQAKLQLQIMQAQQAQQNAAIERQMRMDRLERQEAEERRLREMQRQNFRNR